MKFSILVSSVLLVSGAAFSLASQSSDADPERVARGEKLFKITCYVCHGPEGRGDGPAANSLKPRPRNLTDSSSLVYTSEEDVIKIITKGGRALGLSPIMPAWGSAFSDSEIRDLATFVVSLKSGEDQANVE